MFLWASKKPKNYENRPDGYRPYIIILHYTGMQTFESAYERLSDSNGKVSAHYLINEDGETHSLVGEEMRAWHAGVSYWRGEEDINSASIGIEIVNPGHEHGYRPFPRGQMQSVLKLCRDIISRHDIKYVLGHSDVAPGRKNDPGELFEWKWLSDRGIGLWPAPTEDEVLRAQDLSNKDFEIEKLFIEYGYNPSVAFIDVLNAFHQHYLPHLFDGGAQNQPTVETVAYLLALIRQSKML